jgi:DNA topoisomerase VI subunit A
MDCEEASVPIQVLYDLLFNENKNVPLNEKIDADGCQYLLLVEKEGVMASLIESNFHRNFVPGIMICSQGVPDLCTRQVTFLLHQFLGSNVPVIALTDYNPGGLVILTTFKFGSENLGFDGMKYTIPTTGWLGIRARDIYETQLPSKYFECLTSRDHSLLNSLADKPFFHSAEFKHELSLMQMKVQIEAFNHFGFDFFPRLLAARIQQQEWIV